ncbi:hypothetical protein KJ966_10680 [bacterium]|nr:hypothetical protein [bacterium]
MQSDKKRKESFMRKRDEMRERHKMVQEMDDNSESENKEISTISLESLQEQLQTLKHEINIETIQEKLKVHEKFFKALGEDQDLLFDIIRLYKQKRELKQKNKT